MTALGSSGRAAKKVAVVQSSYIPWKGYFDLINMVDEFVLFDDVQYTVRDWRSRNVIKTAQGSSWLTIPVQTKGRRFQRICDTLTADNDWRKTHWRSIVHNYSRTPYFSTYRDRFEDLYLGRDDRQLSRVNYHFTVAIAECIGISTQLSWSMDYKLESGRTERLVDLCDQLGATEYTSGPRAQAYLDESLFTRAGIAVSYADYSGYPEYHQLFPPFEHQVSIIDLLFNEGPRTRDYMKSFKPVATAPGSEHGPGAGGDWLQVRDLS